MTTSRKKFLTFQEVNVLGHAAQRGVFGGIFGAVEWVTKSWGQYLFFPSATFFSILNFGHETKSYLDQRNKSLGKTASLFLSAASLAVEVLAVTAALTGAILAGELVPVLFFGMICANFLSNVAQTLYHGYKWLSSPKDSQARKQHRTACGAHFSASMTLAAAGTAIGFLLMGPAQHLITLGATATVAVKAATISILGLNAVKTVRDFFVMRNKRKSREAIELVDNKPAVVSEVKAESKQITKPYKLLNYYLLDNNLRNQNDLNDKNMLEKEITADLIIKMEKCIERGIGKEALLGLLLDASQAIGADLIGAGKGAFKGLFINHQNAKRNKKLDVIRWMSELVDTGQARVGTLANPIYVYSFDALKQHIENLGSDVFSSAFATKINGGKMEKLYDLVEYYMKHKDSYVTQTVDNKQNFIVLHS